METNLYYSYLAFKLEKRKPISMILKNVPWWLWVCFGMMFLCFFVGAVTYTTALGELWRKIVLLAGLFFLYLCCVAIERLQIKSSHETTENYWTYIKSLREFLKDNHVCTYSEIEEIKERIEARVVQSRAELMTLKEHDEKWLQALPIPMAIVVVTAILDRQGDLNSTLSLLVILLFYILMACVIIAVPVTIIRSIARWETDKLQLFVDDLQGALDYEKFGIKANFEHTHSSKAEEDN